LPCIDGALNQTFQAQEKIMSIVLTLLPLGLVAASYLVTDIRDRRRHPDADPVCG
jgi:hypothetical protein